MYSNCDGVVQRIAPWYKPRAACTSIMGMACQGVASGDSGPEAAPHALSLVAPQPLSAFVHRTTEGRWSPARARTSLCSFTEMMVGQNTVVAALSPGPARTQPTRVPRQHFCLHGARQGINHAAAAAQAPRGAALKSVSQTRPRPGTVPRTRGHIHCGCVWDVSRTAISGFACSREGVRLAATLSVNTTQPTPMWHVAAVTKSKERCARGGCRLGAKILRSAVLSMDVARAAVRLVAEIDVKHHQASSLLQKPHPRQQVSTHLTSPMYCRHPSVEPAGALDMQRCPQRMQRGALSTL